MGCVEIAYDITKPQPQLFVTPDFKHLTTVLREFERTMAFRLGGEEGLAKAKKAATVCTAVLDSGIQVSGVIADYQTNARNEVIYLRTTGPTQLAYTDLELANQGPEYHREGFSTAIGKLKHAGKPPSELTEAELRALPRLEFESGITVEGELTGVVREENRTLLASYRNCTVKNGAKILFRPEWGAFDLACGERVRSVFGGPADRKKYLAKTGGFKQVPLEPKSNLTPANRELNRLYAEVRALRESGATGAALENGLTRIENALEKDHPADWLLRIELLELARGTKPAWEPRVRERLRAIAATAKDKSEMIERGLNTL